MADVDLTLVDRYVAGECPPAERERVERWLAEAPRRRALAEGLRQFAEASSAPPLPIDWNKDDAWTRIERMTSRPGVRSVPARPWHVRRRWPDVAARIAAALALVAGGALIGRVVLRSPAPASVALGAHVVSAPRGQRIAFRLADGSRVMLAPGSTLRVPADFGERDRTVALDGQAAFTVTHDDARPFAVRTARAVARDLGTRFVVRAYTGDEPTDVVVAEGKVAVTAPAVPPPDTGLVLGPGERARVSPAGGLTHARGVALAPYFAWTEGRLLFRDTPLREAVAELGRWYDVDVRLASPELGAHPFTGSFGAEPAAEALRVVAAALELEVSKTGNTYTLRPKQP